MCMNKVVVDSICKSYGKVKALQKVSFEVHQGELFGLIGPDGAGKTTLFRILTTLIRTDNGHATISGFDVEKDYKDIRNIVGYMPGKFSLYQDLSVEENLQFFATVFGTTIEKNYDLISDIYKQIEPFRERRAGKLSGGMKQKLALCCSLIHRPKVLLLDEPTTGVDPVSRVEFWNMLYKLKSQGISIVVSTPYMDEASRCDRIALMREGKILQIEKPEAICHSFSRKIWKVKSEKMIPLLSDLRAFEDTYSCFAFGDSHHLTLQNNEAGLESLIHYLQTKGYSDVMIEACSPSVEDCFMALEIKE